MCNCINSLFSVTLHDMSSFEEKEYNLNSCHELTVLYQAKLKYDYQFVSLKLSSMEIPIASLDLVRTHSNYSFCVKFM